MIAPSEFQRYLQEICRRYEHWWTVDALTETIADRQATFSFEQMVQNLEKKSEEEKKAPIPSLPIFQEIQNYVESEHILLVGSPGVGKSTALLRCLVDFAKKELEKSEPRIPVLIPLKYKVSFSSPEDPSGMLSLIRDALKPLLLLTIPEVEELLFQKRLILLLDGLNEMPADTVRTHLKKFREECDQSKIPLICTTRELGNGDLGIKRRLQVQPLDPREIERFLRECMPGQAQKVLQLLSRDNRELSRTPFVLWMLYQLFQDTGTAAVDTLGQAFRQFFHTFKKYKEGAPVTDQRRKDWNPWLEHLAFTMLKSPEPTDPGLIISDERAEKLLVEKFGDLHGAPSRIEELVKYHVLERVSEREISFQHQLIQEYYAAEQLAPQLEKLSDKELQYYYLNYRKWTEPLAMAMSFVDSEPLAVRMVKLGMAVDLYLGARLVGEVKQAFQSPVFNLIAKQQVCKKLRIKLLCKTRSEAAVSLLIDLLEDESYSVRLEAVNTLGQIGNKAALLGLINPFNDDNSSVRFDVIDALEQIGKDLLSLDLIKTLEDEKREISAQRFWILLAKVNLGNEFKDSLLKILSYAIEHSDLYIRWGAAIALTQIDSEKSAKILIKAVRNPNFDVQFSAAFALGKMGFEIAVPILEKAIELTDSSDTCRMAIHALAKIQSERGVLAIAKLLCLEENSDKEKLLLTTLYSMNIEEMAPTLRRVLQDPIREYKTKIYRMLNTEDISNRLLQATQDIRPDVVKSSAFLLRTIGNPEMLSTLWQQQTRFFTEELTETIAAIQSRCGFYNYEIYQQAQEADNLGFEDDLIRNLYKDIDKVISQIQENPELRQKDTEDRLTIDIVNPLRNLGYDVSHETKIGGHADIVVRKNDFLWLGEAKIYKDNNNLWEGFQQLLTRYSTGDSNQENSGLLIYIRAQKDASSIMQKWQKYLLGQSLPELSVRPCKMRRLAFISTHKHERSGQPFHVRHIPVMLHFDPKDKSGRARKTSP
jgi:HEAT repeat protein